MNINEQNVNMNERYVNMNESFCPIFLNILPMYENFCPYLFKIVLECSNFQLLNVRCSTSLYGLAIKDIPKDTRTTQHF